MSIASELNALNGYILGAYDEINTKGGTVPTNKNMANLASAIGSISTGSSTTITPLNVTENGTYTAPTGTAYSPVTVNVSGGGGGSFDLSAIPNLTGVASKICQPFSDAYFNLLETPQLPSGANIRLLIIAPVDDITFSTYTLRSLFYLSYGTDSGEFTLTNNTYSFAWWSYGTSIGQQNWWRMGAVSPASYTYKAPTASGWWGRILEHNSGNTSWRPYMPYASYTSTSSSYRTKLVSGANYLVVVGW